MRNEVESIDLVLENCESIRVLIGSVDYMLVHGVTESSHKVSNKEFRKMKFAGEVAIALKPSEIESNYSQYSEGEYDCCGRLTEWADITSVSINYANGEIDDYFIDWGDSETHTENPFQRTRVNSKGELFIWIGKELDVNTLGYFMENMYA